MYPQKNGHSYLEYSKASTSPRRPINARPEGPTDVTDSALIGEHFWLQHQNERRDPQCLSKPGGVKRLKNEAETRFISLRGAALLTDTHTHTEQSPSCSILLIILLNCSANTEGTTVFYFLAWSLSCSVLDNSFGSFQMCFFFSNENLVCCCLWYNVQVGQKKTKIMKAELP